MVNSTLEIISLGPSLSDWAVSDSVRDMIDLFFGVILCTIIAVLGIVGNVINVLVFSSQGLDTSINISFTTLAITDLFSLVTLVWYNLCGSPLLLASEIPFTFPEVKHLTAGFPHACFSRVSAWIIVYILLERCLCVMFPFKVKIIITPSRTALVIASIYMVMILSLVPEYSSMYLTWKLNPISNKTLMGIVFTDSVNQFQGITLSLYGVYMLASFVAVPSLTFALLVSYAGTSRWRSGSASKASVKVDRDRKAVKMVVVVGVVFTAAFSVCVVTMAVGISVPGFSFDGIHRNVFIICFSINFLSDAAHSSIHAILYYKTSSKYRQSFHELWEKKLKRTKIISSSHADTTIKIH